MPGGRPSDPERRERVLAQVTGYVLEHGLDDLSLRPLAAALGTSPRMLLYDFGTKDALVTAIVDEVRRRQVAIVESVYSGRATSRAAVRALWAWLTDPGHAGYLRLHAQVQLRDAVAPRERTAAPGGEHLLATADTTRSDLVLISTVLHGLALRRLGDTDPAITDAAFELFLGVIRA